MPLRLFDPFLLTSFCATNVPSNCRSRKILTRSVKPLRLASFIVSGELTVIPVGAGSPIIIAKNRQSHKPAPAQRQNNRSIVYSPIAFEFLALTNKPCFGAKIIANTNSSVCSTTIHPPVELSI